jgi:hypothetical protein
MKYNKIILTSLVALALGFSHEAIGQDQPTPPSMDEKQRADSLERVSMATLQDQKAKDESKMADARLNKKQTKARAKAAQRVERDATDAAKQSKYAVKAEKRAQRSRKKADRQEQKAATAREKSDNN